MTALVTNPHNSTNNFSKLRALFRVFAWLSGFRFISLSDHLISRIIVVPIPGSVTESCAVGPSEIGERDNDIWNFLNTKSRYQYYGILNQKVDCSD